MKAAATSVAVFAAVLVVCAFAFPADAQTYGPECRLSPGNPFCCHGNFVDGVCVCWEQYFGEACNYNCRLDLCNEHGICVEGSNPEADPSTGEVIAGVCQCDSFAYFGDRCQANANAPTCQDQVQNGHETDVDCGGACPDKCGDGKKCNNGADCQSGVCTDGICRTPTCNDGVKNGQESDIDCGGLTCDKCLNKQNCNTGNDCVSGQCSGGVCVDDADAPSFTGGTPAVAPVTDTSAGLQLQISEPGVVHYVLVPGGDAAPSASAVLAGQAANGGTPLAAGSRTMNEGLVTQSMTIPKALSANTAYDVYFVASDQAVPANSQSVATKVSFTTAATDTFPPTFWTGFPRVTNVQDTAATIEVALNEPGVFYYAVLQSSATAPTVSQVRQGTAPGAVTGSAAVTAVFVGASATASGLTVDTDYIAYVVAEDDASPANLQNTLRSVAFRTGEDRTPPIFLSSFPVVSDISSSQFKLSVQISEPGWYFFVVLPANWAAVPTPLQVIQGVDGDGSSASVAASGSKSVAAAATTTSTWVSDLEDSTTYDLYVVASDNSVNVMDAAAKRVVTTLADSTAPIFLATFPSLYAITSHSVSLEIQLDEPGEAMCIAVPRDTAIANPPTPNDVVQGYPAHAVSFGTLQITASTTSFVGILVGLSPLTEYRVYVVARDDSTPPNLQASVFHIDVDTPADSFPPGFINGYPAITAVRSNDATLSVQLDDSGIVHYVILSITSGSPSAAEIRSATGPGGASPLAAGTVVVNNALQTYSSIVGGALPSSTQYVLWCVASDSLNNVGTPKDLYFTTSGDDTTPPNFVTGFPTLVSITNTGATLHVQLNEPGTVYYVIIFATQSIPTASEVISGTGLGGENVAASGSVAVTAVGITFTVVINGLSPGTEYKLVAVARDAAPVPNDQTTPRIISLTTTGGSCVNNVKDGDETDVDCGGSVCVARCGNGKNCANGGDCASGFCIEGVCRASDTCTGCPADQVTLTPCTLTSAAVCAVKTPTATVVAGIDGTATTTVATATAGAYLVATRNGAAASCSSVASSTSFDAAGIVQEVRLAVNTPLIFSSSDSLLLRAVACRTGSQDSSELVQLVIVNGASIKVPAFYILDPLKIDEFGTTKRAGYIKSVHEVLGVSEDRVSITTVTANGASPDTKTDVAYAIAIPAPTGTTAPEFLGLYNALLVDITNVQTNGTFREALVRNEVLPAGSDNGGGGDNGNNNGGNSGGSQVINDGPGGIFGDGNDFSWLWWFLPLVLLLFICCICCIIYWQRVYNRKHRRISTASELSEDNMHNVGIGGARVESPDFVDDGPGVVYGGNYGVGDGGMGGGGGGADRGVEFGDMQGGSAEAGGATIDLTRVVNNGTFISSAIESKGGQSFMIAAGEGGGEADIGASGTTADYAMEAAAMHGFSDGDLAMDGGGGGGGGVTTQHHVVEYTMYGGTGDGGGSMGPAMAGMAAVGSPARPGSHGGYSDSGMLGVDDFDNFQMKRIATREIMNTTTYVEHQ